jgi:plasmid stability protein
MCQMCDDDWMAKIMDEKITIDLGPELMHELERRAREHGHDVADEVVDIVRGSVTGGTAAGRDALLAELRAFRSSLPPQTTDSLSLLREDRNR